MEQTEFKDCYTYAISAWLGSISIFWGCTILQRHRYRRHQEGPRPNPAFDIAVECQNTRPSRATESTQPSTSTPAAPRGRHMHAPMAPRATSPQQPSPSHAQCSLRATSPFMTSIEDVLATSKVPDEPLSTYFAELVSQHHARERALRPSASVHSPERSLPSTEVGGREPSSHQRQETGEERLVPMATRIGLHLPSTMRMVATAKRPAGGTPPGASGSVVSAFRRDPYDLRRQQEERPPKRTREDAHGHSE